MRAAIYTRKSNAQHAPEEARSVARQEEGARAWCATRAGMTEEARAKMRAAWADPERKARRVAAMREALARPEVKAKLKAARGRR